MVDLGALRFSILTGVPEAMAEFSRFSGTVDSLAATMDRVGKKMTASITAPIAGMEAAIIKIGASYEAEMSKVSAISGATGVELEQLNEKAREIGATTSLSATQAAEGLEYMALAGWKTEEMLEGYDGIVNLALSSTMDLGRASDIVTDYLTAFGLSAKDAGHFADVMAYAMSNSNTTTEMLGEAYKSCAATAKAFGISMEETTAWLGKMADNGIKASEAGTALNATWARLYGENKIANKALQEYNLSLYDAQGNAKGFTQVINEMQVAMANMSQEEQNVFLRNVAGTNHLSDFAAILGTSTDKVEEFTTALEGCDGSSEEMAKTIQDNLKGSITILKSNLEEAALQLYDLQDGVLKDLVDKLNDMVTAFNGLDDSTKQQILSMAAVAAAIGPVLIVVSSLIRSIQTLYGALVMLTAHPVVAIITAIAAALVALTVNVVKNTLEISKLNEKLIETIELKEDLTDATDSEIKALKEEQDNISETIKLYEGQKKQLEEVKARMKEIEDIMNGDMDGYSTDELQAMSDEYNNLCTVADRLGYSLNELTSDIEKQWGSVENLYDRQDAYKTRLENIANANELVEKCTTANTRAMAQEALQLQTTANTAEVLYEKYKTLSEKADRTKEETDMLNKIQKELKNTFGESVLVYSEETQAMVINEKALLAQIDANDQLADSKRKLVEDYIQYGEEYMQQLRKQSEAELEAMKAQLAAYEAANIHNQDTGMLEAKIKSTQDYIDSLNDLLGQEVTMGEETTEVEEQTLEDLKNIYTQKKELGELSLRDQIANLNEMKGQYSQNADDIIDINQFAQSEILDIIQQLVEEEGLSLQEEVKLYEKNRDKFCTNAKAKKKFNDAINDAIEDRVSKLTKNLSKMSDEELENTKSNLNSILEYYSSTSYNIESVTEAMEEVINQQAKRLVGNIKDLNDDELRDVKDTLQDIVNEYKDSQYDISSIMEDLEDVKEEIYDREVEKVKDSVDAILDERKRLYNEEKKLAEDIQAQEVAKIQSELDAIEAQEKADNRKKKEESYLSKLDKAETQEEYDEVYKEYQEWLKETALDDQKSALKAQQQAIKDATKELKQQLEDEYNRDVESYNDYLNLEKEKIKIKTDNESLSDEEVTKKAKENIEAAKKSAEEEKKKAISSITQAIQSVSTTANEELPALTESFTGYGNALYDGITSRDEDIKAYLANLYSGIEGRYVTFPDVDSAATAADKALNASSSSNKVSDAISNIKGLFGSFVQTMTNQNSDKKVEVAVNLDSKEIARGIYDPLQREKERRG